MCFCAAGGAREGGKTNRGYVLFQHLQTGLTTSVAGSKKMKVLFTIVVFNMAYSLVSNSLCISPLYFLSLLSSLLRLCSCKHQCRQFLKALPFELLSMSCVRGQIAAVSHTQYLTQSPELWTHPPPHTVAPLTTSLLPSWQAQSFSKGQPHLNHRGFCP